MRQMRSPAPWLDGNQACLIKALAGSNTLSTPDSGDPCDGGRPRCKSRQGPGSSVGFRDRGLEARNGAKPTVRSSVKLSHAVNDNLIDRTREVWKPRLRRDLSREDARQIAANVTGFFSILAEWSRAEMPVPTNDTADPSTSHTAETRHES